LIVKHILSYILEFNITSTNKNETNVEATTGPIILVLSVAVLISCLCHIVFVKYLYQKINLSFDVVVLLLGFLIGIVATQIKGSLSEDDFLRGELHLSKLNPRLIYYIFLPLIIFDSSFNAHFHIVKQQLITTILLAGPGVLISTGIIASYVVYLFPSDYQWSWVTGLLFGSILSTTDPSMIVTMLQDCGASYSLSSLIDSEALLNDGSVFFLYSIFSRITVGSSHTAGQIIGDIARYGLGKIFRHVLIAHTSISFIGGPLFGLFCGFICVFVLNRINNELKIEITITFAIAYLVFYIADAELGVSAVLALIFMGLYMAKHKYCISSNVQLSMAGAWQIVIFVINILIFTLSGLILAHSLVGIETNLSSRDIGISFVIYLLIHVSRVLLVSVVYPIITWSGVRLNRKERVIFVWSGLRGRTSLILVLLIYLDAQIDRATRERFLFHVSMIVLLTLIINGTTSKFLVQLLSLHKGTVS
jgi:NhaP-type Na+/H+ or K+/H+ antiporter